MRRLLKYAAPLALLGLVHAASAQTPIYPKPPSITNSTPIFNVDPTTGLPSLAGTSGTAVVHTFTRPANTTAYAAGQAVCASTSVDCIPTAFAIGAKANGTGFIQGIQLTKSGVSITNASFIVQVYQTTPTVTGIKDASSFTPKLADINSGAYRGSASCTPGTVNGDNAFYQCTIANPNNQMMFVSDASQQVYVMVQANGAYTPSSAETFTISLSAIRD